MWNYYKSKDCKIPRDSLSTPACGAFDVEI